MLLLFFGIAILALGIFDVGWTVSRYGDNCQADSAAYPGLCAGNHVFVYVGSPLWGGALVSHVTTLRHLIDTFFLKPTLTVHEIVFAIFFTCSYMFPTCQNE
jgi:hypothetical protein